MNDALPSDAKVEKTGLFGGSQYSMPKIAVTSDEIQENELYQGIDRQKKAQSDKEMATKRFQGIDDTLLSDFNEAQREFIVKELYPSLRQAMMHVSRLLF